MHYRLRYDNGGRVLLSHATFYHIEVLEAIHTSIITTDSAEVIFMTLKIDGQHFEFFLVDDQRLLLGADAGGGNRR